MKKLIRAQQQAYEGAKNFYYCFLPFSMIIIVLSDLINSEFYPLQTISMILMYIVSCRFYKLCNQIDTYEPLQQHTQNIQMIEDKGESELQDLERKQINMKFQQCDNNNKPNKYYCKSCEILLPYRSRHCFKCQRCVKRYDHHCFWIGNCVGSRNHRHFYFFLLFQTLHNCIMEELIRRKLGLTSKWQILLIVYSLWILSIGFIIFTAYLLLYHTMLVATEQTTWQHLKRKNISYLKYLPIGYNPFSEGIMRNGINFFSSKIEETTYDIPTFKEAEEIEPGCSLIENQYYSCC